MADTQAWTEMRYVFIVTYARSGSTLLQSLMNSCPGVQMRGENNNTLFHLFKAIQSVEGTRVFGRHPQTKAPDEPWFGSFNVRPRLFETAAINNFVRHVLTPDPGTQVSGFKEIRYNRAFIQQADFAPYMDFLLGKFPGAKIVFNTRSAADVAKSSFLARERPEQVFSWVAEADANFTSYHAGSDRTILMRYEEYTSDHTKVHGLLDFLGLTWDAGMVERVFAKPLAHAKPLSPVLPTDGR